MKKLFAVLVAIALVASFASAQDFYGQAKMSYGGGAGIALPMGSVGDVYGMGFGAFAQGQYGLTPEILGTAQVGYTMFGEKEWLPSYKSSMSAVTILVGAKYNLSKQVVPGFYGSLQIGLYMASIKSTFPSYNYYTGQAITEEITTSGSEFVFAPGVGYQMGNLDFSVRYVINSAVGNLGVNVAYLMPL
jgi:hypothetical protein